MSSGCKTFRNGAKISRGHHPLQTKSYRDHKFIYNLPKVFQMEIRIKRGISPSREGLGILLEVFFAEGWAFMRNDFDHLALF